MQQALIPSAIATDDFIAVAEISVTINRLEAVLQDIKVS